MILIEYPKCSTCKKAKKYLEDNSIKYIDRNIIMETPTKEELKEWIERFSFPLDRLYNTSGMKYRELNLKEKKKNNDSRGTIRVIIIRWDVTKKTNPNNRK